MVYYQPANMPVNFLLVFLQKQVESLIAGTFEGKLAENF
jgi:uncharacterized protein involved in cysteine biosynthesis